MLTVEQLSPSLSLIHHYIHSYKTFDFDELLTIECLCVFAERRWSVTDVATVDGRQ